MERSAPANLLLAGAWVLLTAPWWAWTARTLLHADHRLHLVLAVALLGWVLTRSDLVAWRVLRGPPSLATGPTLTLLLSAAAVVAFGRHSVDIAAAFATGLGTHALLGLWRGGGWWRQTLPAALLLVALLPFSTHLEVFLGFPARAATAAVVGQTLGALGVTAATETILALDGQAAHVDLPCAGVRSLWAGAVFLLGLVVVERRRVGLPLGALAALLAALLLCANALRVGILVALHLVADLPAVAELVHAPLGVVGFTVSCGSVGALGWLVLPSLPEATGPDRGARWLSPGLATVLIALWTVPDAPRPPTPTPPPLLGYALPLDPVEQAFFGATGAAAQKVAVPGGSLLVVTATDWRAHHSPEQCLAAAGHRVTGTRTSMVAPDFPVRTALAGDHRAIWWFQTDDHVTDDLGTRVWTDLTRGPRPWVLVSLLLDGPADPADPALRARLLELRAVLASRGGT